MTPFSAIGIDPALTNLGLFKVEQCDEEGSWFAPPPKLIRTGSLRGGQRLELIAREVEAYLRDNPCDLVILEDYNYKGHNLAELGEVTGLIKMLVSRYGRKLLMVQPVLVKKFATGATQASKSQVMNAMKEANEHLADAKAMAFLGLVILGRPTVIRHEREAARMALKSRAKKKKKPEPWDKDKPAVAI